MINQSKDAYNWYAIYKDETTIPEYDQERPDGRGFAEIDHTQMKALALSGLHCVNIPEGATPIFFRRRSVAINIADGISTPRETVHCIGWKQGEQAVYLFVFEDGSTLLSADLQAV